jgi:hypothetical protein
MSRSCLPLLLLPFVAGMLAATPAGAQWRAAPIAEAQPVFTETSEALQPRPTRAWVSAGIGFASRGPAGHIAGTYQLGGNLLSARAAGTIAVFGDELWDVGLLYGRALVSGLVHASAGAGVGLVGGRTREGIHDDGEALPTTFGVPIAVELFFRPAPVIGLGVYGFGNVNQEESFAGVTAAVQLGRLR